MTHSNAVVSSHTKAAQQCAQKGAAAHEGVVGGAVELVLSRSFAHVDDG